MKKTNLLLALLSFGLINTAWACSDCDLGFRWGFSGGLGLTNYNCVYQNDGDSAMGRLSLNSQYTLSDFFIVGLEAGVQNGNTMRLDIPKPTLDVLGGEPVSIMVKPMVDILILAEITPFDDLGFFGFIKGGAAFRQAQMDRNEVNDLSKTSPELQAGLGYKINDNLAIHVAYQQIFGGNPNYQLYPLTQTASIANIPTQKTAFLGLTLII